MATILYVEDDLPNRILVRRILAAEGHEIVEAGNAEEALQTLETLKPDLILMDINMPEVDGFTLTKRIKQNPAWQHIPIIALTANVMKGDRERVLQAGCDGYIQKPIDVDALPRQIATFLKRGA
ncbi:MAG: response regulator [Chloroflexi bacterium]|nr:response regulator [Chloroflexota bacterium]